MKLQDRIDKIIDYPINLKNVDNTGLPKPNPRRSDNLIYREENLFDYPSTDTFHSAYSAVAESGGNLRSIISTNVWEGSVDNILSLEGYFVGYELGSHTVNFASLLNQPDFAYQLYRDLSTGLNTTQSFFYLLNAMPLSPPVPISAAVEVQKGETFEPNPALLFKNNAGVYSLPEPYMWWLGGVWKYRENGNTPLIISRYVTFEGSQDTGWTDVNFLIDPDKKSTNFFISKDVEDKKKPTLCVDATKLLKYEDGNSEKAVFIPKGEGTWQTGVYYGVEPLNGIGNYDTLFKLLYSQVNLTPLPDKSLASWNIANPLRTFPTYTYDMTIDSRTGYNKALSLYATYQIITYKDTSGQSGQESSLTKITQTSDSEYERSAFEVYSSFWDYIYYNLTSTPSVSYDVVRDKIYEYYKKSVTFTQDQIESIENALFNHVSSVYEREHVSSVYEGESDTLKTNIVLNYNTDSDLVERYQLFKTGDFFKDFIDLVGLQVLQFIEAARPLATIDAAVYGIQDSDFVCMLYPSAGGVAGLQYVLSSLSPSSAVISPERSAQMVKGVSTLDINDYFLNRDDNAKLTSTFINLILNSCRYVWASGPFVGDSPYNVDDVVRGSYVNDGRFRGDIENYNLIGSLSQVGILDNGFLYDNNVHTTRKNRAYILDASRFGIRREGILRYDDVMDYIGCGAFEVFEGLFNSVNVKSGYNNRATDILMSLLIVDKSDFSTITLAEKTYDVSAQMQYLLMYNSLLSRGFVRGEAFIKGTSKKDIVNICKVMNASLTQAQNAKIKRVMKDLIGRRSLLNVGTVFDYGAVDTNGGIANIHTSGVVLRNMFSRALANKAEAETDDGKFVKLALFGTQSVSAWGGSVSDAYPYYAKYYLRQWITKEDIQKWADYFFEKINVQPTLATIKLAKDFFMLYLRQTNSNSSGDMEPSFTAMAKTARDWLKNSYNHIETCLTSVSQNLAESEKVVQAAQVKEVKDNKQTDLNLLKQTTYYNIKSLFDNWIQMNITSDGAAQLIYNDSKIRVPNSITVADGSLIDHFEFLDRANRDVGHNMLVNINWLKDFFRSNYGYSNVSTNISIYTFLSEMAKQHASLIHTLPSFINFGNSTAVGGKSNYAGDLFDTFDYVDIIEANPKFIFQFVGNTNSVLNTPQNKALRSAAKSYSLFKSRNNNKSNVSSNIGDGVHIPKDMMEDGANAMAFVVDFGNQHQQIFSNLQLDQSEYQNTEEYFKAITQFAKERAQTQGSDLFAIFTERSYTAQIDSLGNLMIQPLMYFELTNIPLFYGTYWITNVKHSMVPNDIKTTFKGVRQPMSVLQSKNDVLMQLSDFNINSMLGVKSVRSSGSRGGDNQGGGGRTQTTIFNKSVELIMRKLEGGYFHPTMFDDGRMDTKFRNDYGRSAETMFGIDRGSYIGANDTSVLLGNGTFKNVSSATKTKDTIKFWGLIDGANAAKTWKWNYGGGSIRGQLIELSAQIIFPVYSRLSEKYLSKKSQILINSDKRLQFNFIYATWNGSGWFKKFADNVNAKVDGGTTDVEQLVQIVLEERKNAKNSLITRQVPEISKIFNELKNTV